MEIMNKLKFWAFKKLLRWFAEDMDQWAMGKIKCSFGHAYISVSMKPEPGVNPDIYTEWK